MKEKKHGFGQVYVCALDIGLYVLALPQQMCV